MWAWVLASLLMLPYPVLAYRAMLEARKAPMRSIERANGWVLLFRDMAQFIRESVGPDARVVVLSSPNTSNPTSYFGRFHAIGTLYWENCDGLSKAASWFNETNDDALLRRLVEHKVTHVIFLNEENFLVPYFELQNAGKGEADWEKTFGYRAFFAGQLPVWARPLPYAPPAWLKPLNADVRLLQIEPGQSVPQAFYHIAEYQRANGNLDGALSAIRSAVESAPQAIDARLKLGEILLCAGKADEAARELRRVLPQVAEADRARLCDEFAGLAIRQGARPLAVELLRELVGLFPANVEIANELAWILATSVDDALRNGREAVVLARRAAEAIPDEPLFHGTLGVALAETGDFAGAVKETKRAVELAERAKRPDLAAAARARLEAFAAGRCWRE